MRYWASSSIQLTAHSEMNVQTYQVWCAKQNCCIVAGILSLSHTHTLSLSPLAAAAKMALEYSYVHVHSGSKWPIRQGTADIDG